MNIGSGVMTNGYAWGLTGSIGTSVCEWLVRVGWAVLIFVVGSGNFHHPSGLLAQDSEQSEAASDGENADGDEEAPKPVTTGNPEISLDHLKLLVRPLFQDELEVEAGAWQDLLKENIQELTDLEIAVDQLQAELAEAKEAEEASDESKGAASDAEKGKSDAEQRADETLSEVAQQRIDLLETRTSLISRLEVVLKELSAKGGDPAPYRKYVGAIQTGSVELTDATTLWALLQGWLKSPEGGMRWLWNIIKFLIILIAFWIVAGLVRRIVGHAVDRWKTASQLLRKFLTNVVHKAILLIGLVVALSALEVDVTPVLAAIGAAGFVIGLALQGTLSNFASGLLILAYRPFDVGDVVEAGGVSGTVESVNLLSTHILTFDNKHIIVPNNDVWGGVITNATASHQRRVDLVFGIGYDDDIGKAESILTSLVEAHPAVLADPAPTIRVNELGDSSVNFICRPWCKTADYWTVYWDLTRGVKEAFDREGISIPYPQTDVHVHTHDGGK